MITAQWILKKLNLEQRSWPTIFRESEQARGKKPASVPDALYSAANHIGEAEKVFAKLADEYIPRGKEDEVREVVNALTQARREVVTSRNLIEAVQSVFRPWVRPKPDVEIGD